MPVTTVRSTQVALGNAGPPLAKPERPRLWQPLLVPGLLQTADCARALFLGGLLNPSEDAIDQLVAARLGRQGIVDRPDPPNMWIVLDEIGSGAGYQSPFGPCLVVQPGNLAHLRRPAEGGRPGQCRFPVNSSDSQVSFPHNFQLEGSRGR
jgi:hypothetical protein